jgi:hypothetical protein
VNKVTVSGLKKERIIKILRKTWDIYEKYWYPIFPCTIENVISFDSAYIDSKKIKDILEILYKFNTKILFELREDGILNEIKDFKDYNFWNSETTFGITKVIGLIILINGLYICHTKKPWLLEEKN